jgi:hypothetical protein
LRCEEREARKDLRAAYLTCIVHNVFSDEPKKPGDFFPALLPKKKKRDSGLEAEVKAKLLRATMRRAAGGKDNNRNP